MKQYTIAGSMGHLLDAKEDGLPLSDFTAFEIEELLNLGQKYALPVLLYFFRRIEKSLRGQPAAIVLDEAWIMLGHETFRSPIQPRRPAWLARARKRRSSAASCCLRDRFIRPRRSAWPRCRFPRNGGLIS